MAKYKKKLEDDIRCPLEYGLTIFGGKWKSRIICVLSDKERLRYSEIRKEMYNITDNVPFYVKHGFSVMENGAAIQICNYKN